MREGKSHSLLFTTLGDNIDKLFIYTHAVGGSRGLLIFKDCRSAAAS